MSAEAFDGTHFRQVLGHFPTGVCIVASVDEDGPVGLAIGSFFSVSLEPPLVGFCVGSGSSSWPRIRESGRFCVNVLGTHQRDVAQVFAMKGADKFASIDWEPSPLGSPMLSDAVAWIDCETDAVHVAGDHEIVVGAVRDLAVIRGGRALVFAGGAYHQPEALPDGPSDQTGT